MKKVVIATVFSLIAAFCHATDASLINVDFGIATSAVQSGTAAVGNSSVDIWNAGTTTGTSGTINSLLDSNGNATGVTLVWNNFLYATNVEGAFQGTNYDALMTDYLKFDTGTHTFITITNLAAGSYTLYLYSASNAKDREASFTASTSLSSVTATIGPNSSYISTLTPGVTYAALEFEVAAGDTLTVSTTLISGGQVNVNGFQLQSLTVPEPTTTILTVGGVSGLLAFYWQKRRKAASIRRT